MKDHNELLTQYQDYCDRQTEVCEPQGLYAPVKYLMDMGGKRMRPVLSLMAHDMLRPPGEKAMKLAHAIELFHNFSLMHDDIMDAAPLRRGYPTVHQKWNTATAILSGDLMLIQAYQYLLDATSGFPQIQADFSQMAEEVCKGQQLDMDFEKRAMVRQEEYLHMIDLKTAVLLAFSLQAGARLAGGSDDMCNALYEFGMKIGRGFQLMDDYLDTFGDPEKFGKQPGGDIIEGKKTYLLIHTLEHAGSEKSAVEKLLNMEDELQKVHMVTEAYIKYGAEQAISHEIRRQFRDGYRILEEIPVNSSGLKTYVEWLERRVH